MNMNITISRHTYKLLLPDTTSRGEHQQFVGVHLMSGNHSKTMESIWKNCWTCSTNVRAPFLLWESSGYG